MAIFFLGLCSLSVGLLDGGTSSPLLRILGTLERSMLESEELDELANVLRSF